MFEDLHHQDAQRPPTRTEGEPGSAAVGVGRAQRSEPSRSDGERSGARPTPTAAANSLPSSPFSPHLVDELRASAGLGTTADHDAPHHGQANGEAETDNAAEPVEALHDRPFAGLPRLGGRGKPGRRLVAQQELRTAPLTAEQRLLLLDTWQRSGLPAGDFAALVGLSKHTLYAWKKKFDAEGPAGLMDQPRGAPRGSRLPDLTKRSILMLKKANPDWGCQRISDTLLRGPALPASASAVAHVLHEAGYQGEKVPFRDSARIPRSRSA
jgi:transposase